MAVVKSFRDLIVFWRSEVPVVQKALSALVHFEAREEVLLALERVQARTDYKTSLLKRIEASSKVLSASRGRGDVTPGQVEAPEKVLLTLE